MDQARETVSIYAVGDVCVNREHPESIFTHTASAIGEADISFCQLEAVYAERGSPQVHSVGRLSAKPKNPSNIAGLKFAGFDIVSLAGNHCLDFGYDAFFDTIDNLKGNGFTVIGVGKDLAEARQPAIIEKKGTRIAFLAYNSLVPEGFQAGVDKPGCAPVRASTLYEAIEYQPGTPCRILTFANREDLEAVLGDIKKARGSADVVIVSLHAGLHHVPAVIPMYHKEVSHAAIDGGADLVISHHAHILKGIEVYKGKAIFYGLGNFAFDLQSSPRVRELMKLYGVPVDPDYATYPFHVDAKKTILAKCVVVNNKVQRVAFLPVFINKLGQPEIQRRSDTHFDEVLGYVEKISKDQGLDARFSVDGDEVLVSS
ncbi:MAG: CapA family protein [Chloroflexi bacterium]|nr:CapA family protein [Chloroflexota bacterium]